MTVRHPAAGFTLIEVVITMAVVALLASLAVVSYESSIRKSRRSDARTSLQDLALRLEKCLTQFGTYNDADCAITSPQSSGRGYYSITVTRAAATYTLSAEPLGPQANDSTCAGMTLNQLGTKAPASCW